jgi:hypothetical protein
MRYRLRTLLIFLTWAGLVCMAWRSPTPFWSLAVLEVTLLAILSSVLVTIYRKGRTRAFAVGFLVFAAAYFLHASFVPRLDSSAGHPQTQMLLALYASIHGDWSSRIEGGQHVTEFVRIVNNSTAILAGLLGGTFAQFLYAAPQKDK